MAHPYGAQPYGTQQFGTPTPTPTPSTSTSTTLPAQIAPKPPVPSPPPGMHDVVYGQAQHSITCPTCGRKVITSIKSTPGLLVWVSCVLIFITVVGSLGCCLIPFCVENCHDIDHNCPSCGALVGKYKRC